MALTVPSSIATGTAAAAATVFPRPTLQCFIPRLNIPGAAPPRPLPPLTARASRLGLRLGNGAKSDLKRQLQVVFANTEPTDQAKADSSPEVADGPPLATILAGVVVFLLFCWIAGSILTWLVSLILKPPTS